MVEASEQLCRQFALFQYPYSPYWVFLNRAEVLVDHAGVLTDVPSKAADPLHFITFDGWSVMRFFCLLNVQCEVIVHAPVWQPLYFLSVLCFIVISKSVPPLLCHLQIWLLCLWGIKKCSQICMASIARDSEHNPVAPHCTESDRGR